MSADADMPVESPVAPVASSETKTALTPQPRPESPVERYIRVRDPNKAGVVLENPDIPGTVLDLSPAEFGRYVAINARRIADLNLEVESKARYFAGKRSRQFKLPEALRGKMFPMELNPDSTPEQKLRAKKRRQYMVCHKGTWMKRSTYDKLKKDELEPKYVREFTKQEFTFMQGRRFAEELCSSKPGYTDPGNDLPDSLK